jgi:hypothetical protein
LVTEEALMKMKRTSDSAPISDAELTPTKPVSITSLATSIWGLLSEQLQERLQLFRLEVQQAVIQAGSSASSEQPDWPACLWSDRGFFINQLVVDVGCGLTILVTRAGNGYK